MHDTSLPITRPAPITLLERDERPVDHDWRQGLPRLEGRLVSLRELTVDDGPTLLPLIAAREVSRFLSPPPESLERFASFIDATLLERRAGRYAGFAVVPDGAAGPAGLVQIRQLEPGFGTAEWGIALGSEWWGRGLFLDVSRLLLDFAFTTLGVQRLEARVAARNARGNGAVAKLGAVAEGVLRSSLVVADGTRHDQVLWSWLAEDWRRASERETEASSWVH